MMPGDHQLSSRICPFQADKRELTGQLAAKSAPPDDIFFAMQSENPGGYATGVAAFRRNQTEMILIVF